MPWGPHDAQRHTHKADTAQKQRQWSEVANSALARGESEASAIRQANAVVGHHPAHHHSQKHDSRLSRL